MSDVDEGEPAMEVDPAGAGESAPPGPPLAPPGLPLAPPGLPLPPPVLPPAPPGLPPAPPGLPIAPPGLPLPPPGPPGMSTLQSSLPAGHPFVPGLPQLPTAMPPPPPPPGQSLKFSQVLPPPPQPVEVYIGKIPSFLPYGAVLRILESFGKILRWTRPQVDRAFGFCIFAQEMGALRCTTILPSMTFGPRQESFVVKLGSRESEMLAAFTAVVSTEIEEDIRQRVREIAEGVLASGDAAASAPPPPERRVDPEDASLDPLVKAEIEEFRAASNARDKELEAQRRAVVAAKIRDLSRQRKREAEVAAQSPSKRAREGEEENGEIVDAVAAGTGTGGEAGDAQQQQQQPAPAPDFGVMKIGAASLSLAKSKVAKQAARLFDQEFDDADKPARAIVPIDYSDPVAAPDPLHVPLTEKEIADMIPTSQEELFASKEFSWEAVAREGLLEGAIKAWCVKRMVGFYGQGETADSMARFVLQKLAANCPPRELIAELVAVLDTEADQFVLRLWRMMVFLLIQARNRPPLSTQVI